MTEPTAVASTWIDVCAAVSRPGAEFTEVVAMPGWVVHGDGTAALSFRLPVSATRPGRLAVIHAAGGGSERDRLAHAVARVVTHDPGDGSAWSHPQMRHAIVQANGTIVSGPPTQTRVAVALVALTTGADREIPVLASASGDIRVYRIVDGYAGQLTMNPADQEDERLRNLPRLPLTDQSTWLGGENFERPASYAVPGQPGDRLLLTTPGLHSNLSLGQITELSAGEPNTAAQRLVRAAAESAETRGRAPGLAATAVIVDLPTATESVITTKRRRGFRF